MTELQAPVKPVNGFRPGHEPKPETPVVDFEELSWGDTKKIVEASTAMSGLVQPPAPDVTDVTPEEKEALLSTYAEQMEVYAHKMAEIFRALENVIAPVIISVPRTWMVKRAPENIDWMNGGLNWLKRSRFLELANFVAGQVEAENDDSKN